MADADPWDACVACVPLEVLEMVERRLEELDCGEVGIGQGNG